MAACYKASEELYADFSAKSPKFTKVYEPWKKFRDEQIQWFSIAEGRFDSFMTAAQRSAQKASGEEGSEAVGSRARSRRKRPRASGVLFLCGAGSVVAVCAR